MKKIMLLLAVTCFYFFVHAQSSPSLAIINGKDTRQVNLSFVYHFGSKANAYQRTHHGGDKEEKSRVKVGNN